VVTFCEIYFKTRIHIAVVNKHDVSGDHRGALDVLFYLTDCVSERILQIIVYYY
jgi:hypothetical protein